MYDLITACKSRVALTLDKATCVGILDVDVDAYEDFSKDKCLISNYSLKSKYHDDSNKLLAGNMKDETAGVAIK